MRVRWRHREEALAEQRGLLRQPQLCRLSCAWAWSALLTDFSIMLVSPFPESTSYRNWSFCKDFIGIKYELDIPECFLSSLHLYLCKRFKPPTLSIEQKALNVFEQPSICRCERKAMTYLSAGMWKSLKQMTGRWLLFFRSNIAEHKYFILICTAHLAGIINENSVYITADDNSRANRWGIPTLTSTNTARALFVLWQPLSLYHWAYLVAYLFDLFFTLPYQQCTSCHRETL